MNGAIAKLIRKRAYEYARTHKTPERRTYQHLKALYNETPKNLKEKLGLGVVFK